MIGTGRLILREWRDHDLAPFHLMGQDAEVMRFIGDAPGIDAVREQMARQRRLQAEHGHCFWAVERRDTGAFIGFCGLKPGPGDTPIAGETEIGWRIARAHWRRGFAEEAARASLDRAWANSDAAFVAAITVPDNVASRGLMEKLGMRRVAGGDFNHPALPDGHRLRHHIQYRIARPRP